MIKKIPYNKQENGYRAQAKSLKQPVSSYKLHGVIKIFMSHSLFLLLTACIMLFSSCGIYTFKDVSIPPEVKTIKISYIENKARIVNPQLSPRLTDALQQKIANQTKLTRTASDDAHYQISGAISNYSVSTVGVSGRQTNQNQLTIGVHIVFRNTLQNKTDEFDVSRDFPFSATQSLDQAVNQQFPDILKNLTDEIFNHIFSNW